MAVARMDKVSSINGTLKEAVYFLNLEPSGTPSTPQKYHSAQGHQSFIMNGFLVMMKLPPGSALTERVP